MIIDEGQGPPFSVGDAVPTTASGLPLPAVAVIDTEGIVIGWTLAAEQLLGYPAAEVMNRSASLLLMPRDDAPPPAWAGRGRGREPWSGFLEARHRDGRAISLSVQVCLLSGVAEATQWLLAATELTGRPAGVRADAVVVESLLDRSPVPMAVWDLDLRCVWTNSTMESAARRPAGPALGQTVGELLPEFDREAIETAMRKVLADGVAVVDHEFRGILEDRTDDPVLSASFFRLDGPDGDPLGLYSMAVDVSHSWARRRLAVLSEASTRIGTSLDVMSTAQELADLAVPLLADYVTVDLAESVPLGGEPLQRLSSTEVSVPVFRRAGVASIHAGTPESLWPRGEPVFVPPLSPFTHVLATGRSHFEPKLDTSEGTWLDQDPSRARVIRATGMHSLMIVSLEARGDVLGIAVFVRTENLAPFARDDLLLAEGFADRAALSLDNARRYTHERTAALALQRNLLPRRLTGGRSLDVASSYLPADLHDGVGGDWYDVIPLSGDRVALVVGDVVGHGINAAATMGRLRTAVRTLAYLDLPPDQLLTRLDDLAVRLTDGDGSGLDLTLPDMNATCVYGVYDPATRVLTVALAGHPPPAIVDPDGTVTFPELPAGAPIGVGLLSFESVELKLAEGSMIALYTDGLIETREADLDMGMQRLGAALTQTGLPLGVLCSRVVETIVSGAPAEDDIALLLARTRAAVPDGRV